MKTAYELALERLDSQGIERPGELDEATRRQIAEVRGKAEAELAKLEILHRERLAAADPQEARQADEEYAIDRRRLERRRDDAIARLRDG